jgi:hypothetical protein
MPKQIQRTEPMTTHPMIVAWNVYKTKNAQVFNTETLGLPASYGKYLENRLRDAFESGWSARSGY